MHRATIGRKLRCVSVSCREEHASSTVIGESTTGHPDTTAGHSVGSRATLSSKCFHNGTCGSVEANDSSGIVVLDTMRCPSGVNVVADLKESRSLMLIAPNEHPPRVVTEDGTIDERREACSLREVGGIDSVKVVAAIETSWWLAWAEIAILKLRSVGFGSQIPQTRRRIDDTGRRDANCRVDIHTPFELCCQKWYVKIPLCHNCTRLRVQFVYIVLRSCDEDILRISDCVYQRRCEYLLFAKSIEVAGNVGAPYLSKIGAADDRGILCLCQRKSPHTVPVSHLTML